MCIHPELLFDTRLWLGLEILAVGLASLKIFLVEPIFWAELCTFILIAVLSPRTALDMDLWGSCEESGGSHKPEVFSSLALKYCCGG